MSLHNLCSRHSQYVELQRENKLSLKRISNLIRFSSNYARKIKENIEKIDIGDQSDIDWFDKETKCTVDEEFSTLLAATSEDGIIDQGESDQIKNFIEIELSVSSELGKLGFQTDRLISLLDATGLDVFKKSNDGEKLVSTAIETEVSKQFELATEERVKKIAKLAAKLADLNDGLEAYPFHSPPGHEVVLGQVNVMTEQLKSSKNLIRNLEDILVCFQTLYSLNKTQKAGKAFYPQILNDLLEKRFKEGGDISTKDLKKIIEACGHDAWKEAKAKQIAEEKSAELWGKIGKFAIIGIGSLGALVASFYFVLWLWDSLGWWLIIGLGVIGWIWLKIID